MDSDLLPPVLLEDDGELEEVRRTLEALDIPYAESIGEPLAHAGLLISNARCALARGGGAGLAAGARDRFQIVVVDKVTANLEREIVRLRPDFLLERPVDPSSLRLLVLHALYAGPERRRSERAAMCVVVRYRSRLFTRKATLVDLSHRGCRLLSRQALQPGERLTVQLTRELTGHLDLNLEGRVVAVEEAEDGRRATSVTFGPLDAASSHAVRYVMATRAVGAAPMQPRIHRDPRSRQPADAERRGLRRVRFHDPVQATGSGGSRVLVGRDLSVRGMRVAPDPALSVGDRFDLVLYGPEEHQHTVRAVVERDDGAGGWWLRFAEEAGTGAEALAAIVDGLPSLGDGAATTPNVVVSEVIERR
jgi:hypothetical protein